MHSTAAALQRLLAIALAAAAWVDGFDVSGINPDARPIVTDGDDAAQVA